MDRTYPQTLKKLHFDMHTPQTVANVGGKLDIEKYVEAIKLSGTQSVTLFARCAYGFTYFYTDYSCPHPSMDKDLFGEICTALRKEGIDVTAYFAICRISDYDMKRNPQKKDWLSFDENGKERNLTIGTDLVHTPCITKGYFYGEILNSILDCARNYDINAVWIDGIYHCLNTPCYCEKCMDKYNKDVPQANGIFEGRQKNRWITDQIENFLNTVAIELDKVKPGCTVGADVIGCLNWSTPYPKHVGFVTYDPQTPNLAMNISLALSYTCWRNVCSDMNIQRMRNWQDFNSRSLEMSMTDAAVCASMNSMLICGDIVGAVEVQPNMNAMKLVGKTFAFGENIHNQVKDIPSFADVAIISSPEDTRAYDSKVWKVEPQKFEAAYQCVVSSGLTAHTLFDDDIEENVHKYKAVILPELSYIGEHAALALQKYVKSGGKLIVVGGIPAAVGKYEKDSTADYSIMEKLCGVSFLGKKDVKLSYINFEDSDLDKYFNDFILTNLAVEGSFSLTNPSTAKVAANVFEHGQCFQIGALPIGDESEYPAIATNEYGDGKVIFLSQPMFSAYYKLGNHTIKRLIKGILIDNIKEYAILKGASNAQLVVAKSDNKLAISTILYQGDLRGHLPRVIDEVGEISGIKVYVKEKRIPKNVKSVLGDDVKHSFSGDGMTIEFPPTKIYSGIVFEF